MYDLAEGSSQFLAEGSWPVVSPDGSQVLYAGSAGLEIYDLDRGEIRLLPGTDPGDYRMSWSPAGDRIAFIRSSTRHIMTINSDGSNQQVVVDNSAIYHGLVGWSASNQLLITAPGPQGVIVQALDLASGVTEDLFVMSSNKADTVISPDGAWIAYTNSRGGMLGNGLYISRLDGSQARLLAALDGRALYFPIWSPDGNWLILSLSDSSDPVDQMAHALVSLDACVIAALPDLGGEVYSWGQ